MKTYHSVYSEPVRAVTVIPDIITNENKNEYVVYKWFGAEIAEIQNFFNEYIEPTTRIGGIYYYTKN
jgi:CYTH domain-containing protein